VAALLAGSVADISQPPDDSAVDPVLFARERSRFS
jgi:hypothetical protein